MYRIDVRALRMALALTLTIAWGILFSAPSTAQAQNLNNAPIVFDVRRNLPLEPGEEVYRDFYISAGSEAGFKKGMIIPVVRQISVHNPIINKQQANLNIPVGKLLVMHVERGIAVAREESELTDDDRPTLEFEGIMIGDRVDLAGATVGNPDTKKKQKASAPKASVAVPAVPAADVALTIAPAAEGATSSALTASSSNAASNPTSSFTSTSGVAPTSVATKAPRAAPSVPGPTGATSTNVAPTIAVPVPAPQSAPAASTNPPSA
jgi:hypothetical protein